MNERSNLQYAPAPVERFKECLNSHEIKARLKNSLKNNWTQFQTSMLDLYSGDAYLQKCDPMAVALECVKAATLDLPISKSLGFAYVVPYNNVPTFTLGYKGLIQLAQRTGQYRTINADVVDEGEIRICVHGDGKDIVITVSDNGLGMTKEQCETILKKDRSDSKGIGVKNVNDRLKIYFGDEYGISIDSELDVGTTVTIRIPKIEKGRENEY